MSNDPSLSPAVWSLDAVVAISDYLVTGMHHCTPEGRKAMADIIAQYAPPNPTPTPSHGTHQP